MKIDKKNQRLLEIKTKAVNEPNKLQDSSRDKGKGHSETQTVRSTVSSMVVV